MKQDTVIADIRKVRDELSKRFNGDIAKICAFFKEEERKSGRRIKPLQRSSSGKTD